MPDLVLPRQPHRRKAGLLTPILAILVLLAILPAFVLLVIGTFPGLLIAGPPRRLFYWLHRLRHGALGLSVVAELALVGLWWSGRVAAAWPLAAGVGLVVTLVVYLVAYPEHAFRPIRHPVFRAAGEVDLPEDLPVLGIGPGRGAPPRAYTLPTLVQAHGAIDRSGDRPGMVTWCTLANTGSVLRPDPALGPLEELHSATAINDNICFYQPVTGNLIQQIENRVVCGPAAGQRLDADPVMPVSWGVWREMYPDTKICDMPPHRLAEWLLRWLLLRIHERLPARKSPFHRMDRPPDPRLPLMTAVLALELAGEARAWPCTWLYERRVVSTEVGSEPLVLFGDETRQVTTAFSRRLTASPEVSALEAFQGQGLEVAHSPEGSVWDLAGRCVAGPRAGARLGSVPHFPGAYWYAWARAHPDTRLPDGVP